MEAAEEYNKSDLVLLGRIIDAYRSMTLKDWYGLENYPEHIKKGRKYYANFEYGSNEAVVAGQYNDVLITITYVRSGVAFYIIDGHPGIEFHFNMRSVFGAWLRPEKIPMGQLTKFTKHVDNKYDE